MKITKESNIAGIIKTKPNTQKIFADYGLYCVGCFASKFDNIEEGAKAHGFDDKTIDELVKDINEFIKE
ncbi:disulfide oxidoreductase [candidate division WWE3 bacterium CG08_land_8_20_14_0_20_40_13]|uniref:Disulfide oxidoreductase n=1 Tax=candidate division WWE3 bacterium CG08_land_8_20_14_0_20_40_13 TaxID=1975084 RepID=A0A2H0XG36_UNCKA|nr:MAG: disulfide oxidoreductase [candidate division WWE3 bacterium CG08_land_8_20_14_0_20_40_13]